MLNSLVDFFTAHIPYWPLVSFFLLLLAGLNLPVSEDAVVILSAGVAFTDESLIVPNWIALYLGIFISDIMVYWMGVFISKGLFQVKKIRKKLTPQKVRLVAKTLDDYGFRTFILCRFIPFGVRNTLWLCSGIVALPFRKFILYDSIAALISCSTLYNLVLFLGNKVSVIYKVVGVVLFVALVALAVFIAIRIVRKESKSFEIEDQTSLN